MNNIYITHYYYKFLYICIFLFALLFYYNNYSLNYLNNIASNYWFKKYIELYKEYIPIIQREFQIKGTINLNKVILNSSLISNNTINIGFTLDSGFILETMLTMTSIIATQKKETQI